jgi:hypothetical protein
MCEYARAKLDFSRRSVERVHRQVAMVDSLFDAAERSLAFPISPPGSGSRRYRA